jgi:hypothetical protein
VDCAEVHGGFVETDEALLSSLLRRASVCVSLAHSCICIQHYSGTYLPHANPESIVNSNQPRKEPPDIT